MTAREERIADLLQLYGPPMLQSLAAVVIAWLTFALLSRGLTKLSNRGLLPTDLRRILNAVIKWLIMIALLLVVLGLFGISVASFWAALSGVLVLLAIGFVAVWSLLSNLLCSVLLIIFAPFRIEDEIEVQDPASPVTVRGKVLDINLMFTTLRVTSETEEESLLRIPNNIFFQKYVRTWQGRHSQSIRSYMAGRSETHKQD
ncbi:MAG: mechanosensitive ion channel [Gammaproteobacteria bacterium]|nr:mechanosensitive ion channel [Gammaproteobacteria bacterium]